MQGGIFYALTCGVLASSIFTNTYAAQKLEDNDVVTSLKAMKNKEITTPLA